MTCQLRLVDWISPSGPGPGAGKHAVLAESAISDRRGAGRQLSPPNYPAGPRPRVHPSRPCVEASRARERLNRI
jgi:hypothetical protein